MTVELMGKADYEHMYSDWYLAADKRYVAGKQVPKTVTQDALNCWAAALESWLAITPGRKPVDQAFLSGKYATNMDNWSISPEGLDRLLKDTHPEPVPIGMDYQMFSGAGAARTGTGYPVLSWGLLASLLWKKSSLFAGYFHNDGSGWWHCIVIHRISYLVIPEFSFGQLPDILFNPSDPDPDPYRSRNSLDRMGLTRIGEKFPEILYSYVSYMDPMLGSIREDSVYGFWEYNSPILIGWAK